MNAKEMCEPAKKISVQYFALLREQRGCSQETLETNAETPLALYRYLQERHGFRLDPGLLKVAVNDTFVSWETPLNPEDRVVFIPPVAGG
ncbi:MAG TPA: MoaD/ThiS family protein [Coleofasciculaceae cyanobacterium]|jgi:molybdopterin converting factor subunit 1